MEEDFQVELDPAVMIVFDCMACKGFRFESERSATMQGKKIAEDIMSDVD